MQRLSVPKEKESELKKLMRKLKIFNKDFKETFIRSSGPGGQNVNKVSTCVVLKHIPTGIQVKCQEARLQSINRYKARFMLVKKIEKRIHDQHLRDIQKREKARRRNRKRPKFLKEKILQDKHKRSERKSSRKKIDTKKLDQYM